MHTSINIKKLHPGAAIPRYATAGAAGFDLCVCEDTTILPERCSMIPIGLAFELPEGYHMQILPRSGLSREYPGYIANSPGLIDPDFRGEVKILFYNQGSHSIVFREGTRIAQGVIMQHLRVAFRVSDSLSETERGSGGFGSTGLEV